MAQLGGQFGAASKGVTSYDSEYSSSLSSSMVPKNGPLRSN